MTLADRFARRLKENEDGCLEFQGCLAPNGYGQIWAFGRVMGAHRAMWTLILGPVPDGLLVLHRCDNRKCCNVEHLFLGTAADNTADMLAKGRHSSQSKTHCINGHALEGDNVLVHPSRPSTRRCQICWRATCRQSQQRMRERVRECQS
jgi:hypothetical protein